jgi:hypothetical protein
MGLAFTEGCSMAAMMFRGCAKLSWNLNGSTACGVMMLFGTSTATEGGAVDGQCATFGRQRQEGEAFE